MNSRVRSTGKWYLNNTWEAYLPELNTEANQYTFRYGANGQPLLLGLPIVWTEVLQAFTEDAAAASYPVVFGDLSWWWFGQRPGGPRIDISEDVLFQYDQLATRFIEEIDFDYMDTAAVAVGKTAAA